MPGIIIAIIQWILWFVLTKFTSSDTAVMISIFGALLCGLAIIVWWAFFSRAPKHERWIAIILMIAVIVILPSFMHPSIQTGFQGMLFYFYIVPILTLSLVIWAVISNRMSIKPRMITMVLTFLFVSGAMSIVRSEGITGNADAIFQWRWAETSEDRLLSQAEEESIKISESIEYSASWPGFRGPNRDGIVHGVKIETDWNTSPPQEIWRQKIGPGCGSFSVKGSMVFTQEQRGEDEVVSCYDLNTGKSVWKHYYNTRFWDSHAGAGPRSTPTLNDSLVYTLGATGILNVLNEDDGSVVWSRNAATDIEAVLPGWGYASSPLVVDDVVIVAIAGTLCAYDIASGESRWVGPKGGENYSSPHLVTINGTKQVLINNQNGTSSFVPADGKLLWERPWEIGCIVQPAIISNGDMLISEGYKKGIHRINVSDNSGEWKIEERWMTSKIRPDFNDFVIHKDHIYGYEGLSLTCLDLKDGTRKWKAGRYGGQIILIAAQDILLVLSEKGEIALVSAVPDQFSELGRIKAIEGKTWNHPVLVNDIVVVRNTKEMVAYRLAIKDK